MKPFDHFQAHSEKKSIKKIDLAEYVAMVKGGHNAQMIARIRAESDPDTQKKLKLSAQCVSMSCGYLETATSKSQDQIEYLTGLIGVDIDPVGPGDDFSELSRKLEADPYVIVKHHSTRGIGLFVVHKIDPERFEDAFLGLERYYWDTYGVVIDPACKNRNRLRIISHDPDVFYSPSAKTFRKYLPAPKRVKTQDTAYLNIAGNLERVAADLARTGFNLDSFDEWTRIGFSLASEGESGREAFHILSQNSAKYKAAECDRKFKNLLQTGNKSYTLGTFYFVAKENGVAVYTESQEKTIRAATQHKRRKASPEDVVKFLKEQENITGVEAIVKAVFESKTDYTQNLTIDAGAPLMQRIGDFISKTYNIAYNTLTNQIELDGRTIRNRDIDGIYLDVRDAFTERVSKADVYSILAARSTEYNPVQGFVEERKDTQPKGALARLAYTVKGRTDAETARQRAYITKWYVGMVKMAVTPFHDPDDFRNELMLVLVSPEHGRGKTYWFEHLLPERFRKYFAKSSLDKDVEQVMSNNFIVLNDEFAGKSAKDSEKMKSLLSTKEFTFRKPYDVVPEKTLRIGSLCGTDNKLEVIKDPTGNRRMLPVFCHSIDQDLYNSIDKENLFVEAYNMVLEGYDPRLLGDEIEELEKCTHEFIEADPVRESLDMYYRPTLTGQFNSQVMLTNTEILKELQYRTAFKTLSPQKLGQVLRKAGYEQRVVNDSGVTRRLWVLYETYSVPANAAGAAKEERVF